ncbi:MAG: hypothetical protein ACOC4M_08125 [Promethearchaeia archaeon]
MKPYYCPECDRKHYRGKIYKDHLKYKTEEKDDVPAHKFINPPSYLKIIARKQIQRLIKKWLIDKNPIYVQQINRVILHEK